MDHNLLEETAKALVRTGHGILAADDSVKSSAKRFEDVGLEHTEETRRVYRQTVMTTPGVEDVLSGVILYEETFKQKVDSGETFAKFLAAKGILPGIKLDQGLQDLAGFPGEKIVAGLDALPDRAKEYAELGARFAKWRAVISIGDGLPTDECIGANIFVLARYARICQDNNIVPIVEPEVVMDGTHTSERCEQVMAHVYDIMFQTLRAFRVHLSGCVMKTGMVVPGKSSEQAMDYNDVAERTVRALAEHTPPELGGTVFLSGGQSTAQAFINLNRIEQRAIGHLPFGVTFSYMRALQDPPLAYWAKHVGDVEGTQKLFKGIVDQIGTASLGKLDESMMDHDLHHSGKAQGFWEY